MSPQLTTVQMNNQPKVINYCYRVLCVLTSFQQVIQTNLNNNGSNGSNNNSYASQHQGFNDLTNVQMQSLMPMNGQFQPQQ